MIGITLKKTSPPYAQHTEWTFDAWTIRRVFKGLYAVLRRGVFVTSVHSFKQARKVVRDDYNAEQKEQN